MKQATITRHLPTDQGTFGDFRFGDARIYTTELPWRENAKGKSCIPAGTYKCKIVQSPKHGRVYEVQNVKGRDNIQIHAANFAGDVDKGWKSELLGCIAPCLAFGPLAIDNGARQMCGLSSKQALAKFMAWANGEEFELVISEI